MLYLYSAMTVRTLRSLLVLIKNVSVVESNIFPLYIFPSLSRIARDPEPSVRITPIENLPPDCLVNAIRSPRGDQTGVE